MLQLTTQKLIMSSREIAELTNKNHADVLRDIRKLFEELKVPESYFAGSYTGADNTTRPMFNLPKRECLILVSGYSIQLRAKIIDRWQELENQQSPKLPQTYLEALENLVAVEKERARLQSVNNALMHVNKLYSSTEIAKELGMRSGSKLNTELHNKGIQFKTGGTWVLYAGYSEMGLISIKQDISPSGHTFYDRRWTPKGREFILALFGAI